MLKLNARWIYAAHVYNVDGTRAGTALRIENDNVVYLVRGVEHTAPIAYLLDNNLLRKPEAVHKQFVK